MPVYDRVEFVRERLESLGHGGFQAGKVTASGRLLQRIVEQRARRKKPRWPGDREDHRGVGGDQPRHIIEESLPKCGFRRAENGRADARPFGIMGGGKSVGWESTNTPRLC